MLLHDFNLRLFVRVLLKNRLLSFINVVGLSSAIAGCLLIVLYVNHQLDYDAYVVNKHDIFRIVMDVTTDNNKERIAVASTPLAPFLEQNYQEVRKAVRIGTKIQATIRYGDNLYRENELAIADPGVFRMFSLRLLSGDAESALQLPNSIVLTRRFANKYFGNEDPFNKILSYNKTDYRVTGVMEDVPSNSDLKFTAITSLSEKDRNDGDWFSFEYHIYVLFDHNSVGARDFLNSFEQKLITIAKDKYDEAIRKENLTFGARLHLQPVIGIHFQPSLVEDTPKEDIYFVYIFILVGLLILLIGSLNYINFSIAQSIVRGKEVGIRKVIGAHFRQLVTRYLFESILISLLTGVVGLGLAILLLPMVSQATNVEFTVQNLLSPVAIGALGMIILMVGILAGSYPAFYISSIAPGEALRGKWRTAGGGRVRKVSIIAQFAISMALICCTVVAYRQMNYIANFDLGFTKNNILLLNLPDGAGSVQRARTLKEELLTHNSISAVAIVGHGAVPGEGTYKGSVVFVSDGKRSTSLANFSFVDEDYLNVLGIGIRAGRSLDSRTGDPGHNVMVNEALVKRMGWKKPLDQKIVVGNGERNIVGVIKDYHYGPLYNKVEPQILSFVENAPRQLMLSFDSSARIKDQITLLAKLWRTKFPDDEFSFHFLDRTVQQQYKNEDRATTVFSAFSVLTIVIACLGLFGLSSLSVYQRKKEVGVRKIMGANFVSVFILFLKEYLGLILVSIVIAIPASFLLMDRWLRNFPYRLALSPATFIVIPIAVVAIAGLTIAFTVTRVTRSKSVMLVND